MRPHSLALCCLIAVAGVSAWSIPSGTNGHLQPHARYQQVALFVSSEGGATDADTGAAADIDDVSIEYNAAAKLAYKAWQQQYAPPRLKASQRVLLSAEEVEAAGGFDPEKFATFERNYEIVTVANVRAKRAARMYGGEAEVVTLGPDADTVPLPMPPSIEPDTSPSATDVDTTNDDGDNAAAGAENVDVTIQYNAPAQLAYDEWLAANERAGEEIDDSKFKTFEQNYIAITVTNVSAKKAVRDAGESVEGNVPVVELGPDADSVLLSDIGDISSSTFSWGIFEDEQVIGSINDTMGRMGSLSFGEKFGQAFKWEPSKDDRLRSALGIDDSSSSSDSPDTDRGTSFFFTGKKEETPHPPKELPSDQDMKEHASDEYEVLSEGGEDFESKTVAELRDMLKEKGMPVSGKKSELIDRLQNASDADSEIVKETQKVMEKDFGISLSTDKIREILVSYFV